MNAIAHMRTFSHFPPLQTQSHLIIGTVLRAASRARGETCSFQLVVLRPVSTGKCCQQHFVEFIRIVALQLAYLRCSRDRITQKKCIHNTGLHVLSYNSSSVLICSSTFNRNGQIKSEWIPWDPYCVQSVTQNNFFSSLNKMKLKVMLVTQTYFKPAYMEVIGGGVACYLL